MIRVSPVRLIDQNDQQVGIVETPAAQTMAREAELDLVEVAPDADPPVCRIMDYGKWKYQQKKKEQKARSHSKTSELKEVWMRPKTDEHDMHIKSERAIAFLKEGHKVQFTMRFRGRENVHRNIGLRIFRQIEEQFAAFAKVEVPARVMGRRMTMILVPSSGKAPTAKPPAEAAAKPAPQPTAAPPPAAKPPAEAAAIPAPQPAAAPEPAKAAAPPPPPAGA